MSFGRKIAVLGAAGLAANAARKHGASTAEANAAAFAAGYAVHKSHQITDSTRGERRSGGHPILTFFVVVLLGVAAMGVLMKYTIFLGVTPVNLEYQFLAVDYECTTNMRLHGENITKCNAKQTASCIKGEGHGYLGLSVDRVEIAPYDCVLTQLARDTREAWRLNGYKPQHFTKLQQEELDRAKAAGWIIR